MTEAEWLECADPTPMLAHLLGVPTGEVWCGALDGYGHLVRGGSAQRDPPPLPDGPAVGTPEERALRLFACACCRRVWDVFGEDAWTARHVPPDEFGTRTNPGPTGRLDDLFDDAVSLAAVDAAEGWCDGAVDAGRLRAAGDAAWELARAAYEYHGNADYRLGDHYSGSEHDESERSYLTARAAALACAPDIRRAAGEVAQAIREVVESGGCGRPDLPPTEGAVQAAFLRDIVGNPFRPVSPDPSWRTSTVLQLAEGIHTDRAFDRLPILADALMDAGCGDADVLNHCRSAGPHVRGCWVIALLTGRG